MHGELILVVAEYTAIFSQSSSVGGVQNLTRHVIANKNSKSTVIPQMQRDGSVFISLIHEGEVIQILDHLLAILTGAPEPSV